MNNLFQLLSSPLYLRFTEDEVGLCNKYIFIYILGLHFMEVNVAISIKVDTLFRGRMYFIRGGGKLHERKEIFPPGERKYFLPPVTL